MNRMGGWWRLWLIASLLLGVGFWMAEAYAGDVSDYRSGMSQAEAQAWVDASKVDVRKCGLSGIPIVQAEGHEGEADWWGSYSCTSDRRFLGAFLWALAPGILLAATGLILRWVYRGFRRPEEK